jgi:type II secretory pathway pseudopilin PulG
MLVVAIIAIVAAIAIPNLVQARRASNESSAIANLKTIGSAEATYGSQKGVYAPFSALTSSSLLDAAFSDGCIRNRYMYDEVSASGLAFEFQTKPVFAADGNRSFNIVEDFVVRQSPDPTTAPSGMNGTPVGVN